MPGHHGGTGTSPLLPMPMDEDLLSRGFAEICAAARWRVGARRAGGDEFRGIMTESKAGHVRAYAQPVYVNNWSRNDEGVPVNSVSSVITNRFC